MTGTSGALRFIGFLALLLATNTTLSQAMDLDVRNPSIDALKVRISHRAASVQKWKDSGAIGEDAKGTLTILPQAKLSLAERKEARDLVVSENEDRAALFREWGLANLLGESDLPKVALEFARKQRTSAAPNHWVEDLNSKQWIQRKDLR